MKQVVLTVTFLALLTVPARCQSGRTVGKFEEVFSWKQMTYDINGIQGISKDFQLNQQLVSSLLSMTTVDKDFFDGRIDKMTDSAKKSVIVSTQAVILSILPSKKSLSTVVMLRGQVGDFFLLVLEDRFSEDDLAGRDKRSADSIYFDDNDDSEKNWNHRPAGHINGNPIDTPSLAPINPDDEIGRFFIQYNNVPMGAERVGNRLFVTVPRRRFGIPSTLNYIDLSRYEGTRSPPLTPYPDMARSRSLISVYRTRADECGRLWTVDTGTIEIPNSPRYLQPPAIVVFDLKTDRQILRYQLKSSDLPANNTPTGLASITVAIKNGDCSDAYAFISDVVSYGIIVFSLKQRDSWRQEHNYFHFNPTAGNMRVAGQSFTWNDGVFSVAVGQEGPDGCRPTYFHPMVSNQEFAVSSCELESREANQTAYRVLGDRGTNSQSTMHGLHTGTNVMFFAEVGRDSVSCWNTERPLSPDTMEILAQDNQRLSYPSDLHVSDDEVWVTANTLPRFIYSRLDTNDYNFYIYRAKVRDLITGTACAGNARPSPGFSSGYGG